MCLIFTIKVTSTMNTKTWQKKFHAGPYQFLDLSIVKVFQDNLIKHGLIEAIIFLKEEENIVGKVKNACDKHSLVFHNFLQRHSSG